MKLLDIAAIQKLLKSVGVVEFYKKLALYLEEDFSHWLEFEKSPRHAVHVENGVIEVMPIAGRGLYSFKYVNGHPLNSLSQRLCVVAVGLLSETATGYPILLSEMTLLTALRTAATAAIASQKLSRSDSQILGIIGCGAQSEFQILAHYALLGLRKVYYYDRDPSAMKRFKHNLSAYPLELIPANCARSLTDQADIVITATAAPGKHIIIQDDWIRPGQHICGIGGDSPGKTELDPATLNRSKVVVEYLPQTAHEGEIQNLQDPKAGVYSELWEIITHRKPARSSAEEITVFDSVGFALEDYSILRLVLDLSKQQVVGQSVNLIPENLSDSKNLFGLLGLNT